MRFVCNSPWYEKGRESPHQDQGGGTIYIYFFYTRQVSRDFNRSHFNYDNVYPSCTSNNDNNEDNYMAQILIQS